MRYGLVFMGLMILSCHSGPGSTIGEGTSYHVGAGYSRSFRLPDGSKVVVMPGSTVTTAKGFGKSNRDLDVDGEVVVEVAEKSDWPFVVHTRDLVIEVLEGGSRFHIEASRSRPGEETDLLEGRLRVKKSYHSTTDNEPETLTSGEMVMVNRDIDLMEKEKLSPDELEKVKAKVRN